MAKLYFGGTQCACPTDEIQDTMAIQECYVNLKQMYRIAYEKLSGAEPFNSTTQLITDQASWTTAQAALDPDKLSLTPQVAEVVITGGTARVVGGEGSNETPEGAEISIGDHTPTVITGVFVGLTLENAQKLLKDWTCNSALKMAFIDIYGKVLVTADTDPKLFKVLSASIDGSGFEGAGTLTKWPFRITLAVNEFEYRQGYDISSFYKAI